MKKDLIYNEWLPYDGYEKQECDIKLHDGTIVHHLYPNAGEFNRLCGVREASIPESEVSEIMYKYYYMHDLCTQNCNNHPDYDRILAEEQAREAEEKAKREAYTYHRGTAKGWQSHNLMPDAPMRQGDKIHRNDPCPCGSGKKYKKCCI